MLNFATKNHLNSCVLQKVIFYLKNVTAQSSCLRALKAWHYGSIGNKIKINRTNWANLNNKPYPGLPFTCFTRRSCMINAEVESWNPLSLKSLGWYSVYRYRFVYTRLNNNTMIRSLIYYYPTYSWNILLKHK